MKAIKTFIKIVLIILLILLIVFSAVRIVSVLREDEPTDEPTSSTEEPSDSSDEPSGDYVAVEEITLDDITIYFYAGE